MTNKPFEFSIIASGLDHEADDFEARFFDAGCDDATISFQKGHIILDFSRVAPSLKEAICSAVECVLAAGATVDRIEPDPLVNLNEIAARVDLSRAAVTQFYKGQRGEGDFPAPSVRVTSEYSLWEWATVARWFVKTNRLDESVAAEAEIVEAANFAIKKSGPIRKSLEDCLAA